MKKVINKTTFGDKVEGYAIPVLNEREIRAAAGILFLALFVSLSKILFEQDFLLVKYVIVVFLTDFIVRVFISPRYSPTLIIGRLIVRKQVPEYVGARQKKFAWKIGLALSGLMFFLLVLLNSYSILTGIGCLVCLVFLFVESSFGICVGCLFYRLFYKDESVSCAGSICAETKTVAMQKISWVQIVVVFATVVYVLLAIAFFNDYFRVAPRNIREIIGSF